jgi:hypothetical protein
MGAWRGARDNIPQGRIRVLVARIAAINILIIEYKGGNEFYRYYICSNSNLLVFRCFFCDQKSRFFSVNKIMPVFKSARLCRPTLARRSLQEIQD